ncbi:hypothetical protein GCK72_003272 [Caenorhabditis remanei]|uniref:VWFA domain-containing protein n=1 Tax=Caenorhabditis remanei TaxID=31234 RepID=A0A6A5HWY0_CAERE|nr:hypothetical protein GCK72_003272 [Caenorhabditis remanei]KAF1771446.1 hypothetical protein GCK72_003272 [Caenorhabditis remanei]
MKFGLLILLLLISVYADYSPLSYVDRPCGSDLSNLWLDVIAVVDNSRGMTVAGLDNVAANIASAFSSGTRIGSDANKPRTTRLGLVTYNSAATQKADLNQYQSIGDVFFGIFDALSNIVNTNESYLATGLELAERMLIDQSVNSTRAHYQKVVIVYASEYAGNGELDPLPIAERLKLSGVNIITVAYGDAYGLMKSLSHIASPANCFCPNGWVQYRSDYSDLASSRYGVCIQGVALSAKWLAAKMSCSNRWRNSSLAAEFSQDKHDFIFNLAQNTQGFSPPYKYHIGLNYVSGSWVWTQPTGLQQVPLQQPLMWLSGNPQQSSTQSGVMNMQSGQGTGWISIAKMAGSANYVCETYSCDTDNYCDENMNKNQ